MCTVVVIKHRLNSQLLGKIPTKIYIANKVIFKGIYLELNEA